MTIHHEVSEFIVRNDTQIVELECNDNHVQDVTSVSSATLRTITLPPLGFPPLPDFSTLTQDAASDLNNLLSISPDQIVSSAISSLPLWFLIGGFWALITSLSVSTLKSELSSLSFLFMPQSNSLAITKSAVDQGLKDLDKALAAVFLSTKTNRGYHNAAPQSQEEDSGILDGFLRLTLLGLSLISGPLQFVRHILGLIILKTCPNCRVKQDFMTWLDNISASDTIASSYIMEKMMATMSTGSGYGQGGGLGGVVGGPSNWQGDVSNFPNFENQFEGLEGV